MDFDYGYYATHHVKALAAMIYHLVVEENLEFDLIIGSGNTGILCAKFTELVYQKLAKPCPSVLQVPVLRYRGEEKLENLFDNSILYSDVESFLRSTGIQKLEKVLFVDDEIYSGHAVKACMKLLVQYKKEHALQEEATCYIVAEDQGMSSDFSIPSIKTKFYPFATGVDGTSNVITYFLPYELENPIKQALEGQISEHVIINVLLGLPIRKKITDTIKPEFSYKWLEMAEEKLANFSELQEKASAIVNLLINQGIKEYKTGKIEFPKSPL